MAKCQIRGVCRNFLISSPVFLAAPINDAFKDRSIKFRTKSLAHYTLGARTNCHKGPSPFQAGLRQIRKIVSLYHFLIYSIIINQMFLYDVNKLQTPFFRIKIVLSHQKFTEVNMLILKEY